MRDEAAGFYVGVINQLIEAGTVSIPDSVLVVCGGPLDEMVMRQAGLSDFTISNLDDGAANHRQDAENLTFDDGSFDIVVVHAGLHHCHSPHRALLEMYRVARKAVIVLEARDSLAMQIAKLAGFTPDFELEAVTHEGYESGGVGNGPIPNFIYRWTEREVEKTIRSFDPAHVEQIRYFYGLRLPSLRFEKTNRPLRRIALRALRPAAIAFSKLFPKQGNQFGFAIIKTGKLRHWLEYNNGKIRVSSQRAEQLGQSYRPT
jgi:SAM-dependent methyltransferase